MSSFTCVSISPIHLAHPGIAVATARARGVGVLDAELCPADSRSAAADNLSRLLELTADVELTGIRLRANQISECAPWLDAFGGREHWLIICGWRSEDAMAALRSLKRSRVRRVWLELLELDTPAPSGFEFDGWIARGSEAGGWAGAVSSFLLAQSLATRERPFIVQGGIGKHSAAACRLAGAAGVVLDDQLLAMPESPLSTSEKELAARIGCDETVILGEAIGAPCRVLKRPGFRAAERLALRAAEIESSGAPDHGQADAWRAEASRILGWGPREDFAWPLGQAAGFAGDFARRHKSTGRLVCEIIRGSAEHLESARRTAALAVDGPLAGSHGVRYPIAQGPMTRVSDRSQFAAVVAEAGALPFLALALTARSDVERLLAETKSLLKTRPWGVGILGFVPPDLRAEQLAAIEEARPPFALISGGRPEQAFRLEAKGIATYLHVPSPGLLRLFVEQGARRFVFEGSECGGHVGPLSSFTLWDSMVETLLHLTDKENAAGFHVLFAGGVHDGRSAAMAAALAAPLSERGVRIGVLAGTAYLFTHEAVSCGSIVPSFQQEALACRNTVKLVTGPGHAIRCAATPFAGEFANRKRALFGENLQTDEMRQRLEGITLGRSRVASKGLIRGTNGELTPLLSDDQRSRGMYMMGEVAALRNSLLSVEELHREISVAGSKLLDKGLAQSEESKPTAAPARVAVVGIACQLPGSDGPKQFWRNLLDKTNCISEVPSHRWDWRLYFDANPEARDKIYSKWGGFLSETEFDPIRFGIPPNSLKSITTSQLLGLELARRAIEDAGYSDGSFSRRNTAVIFGVTNPADLQHLYVARSMLPLCSEGLTPETWQRLPEWSEESLAGVLMNVMAGRVANRLDLGGPTFTVDAACASSLAALDLAIQELTSRRSDVVITGGIDLEMTPYTYLCFSKTRALSPTGQARVFDETADGIVLSEGVVAVVLKRLDDAERDGDRIYGVIQAVAGSSDGKGLGITAPRPEGQRLALQRAYERAGIDCATLGMYEAHGTGTAAGDRAELETIVTTLNDAGAPAKQCAVGSAKSLLGHTKAAAGMVALVKSLLALYYKTIPPHAGVERPLGLLANESAPIYVHQDATPWLKGEHPRRAGLSAFGFGGINFHAVVEEYDHAPVPHSPGAPDWPWELFVLRAETNTALAKSLERLEAELDRDSPPSLRELALRCANETMLTGAARFSSCLVVQNREQLREGISSLLQRLAGNAARLPAGIYLRSDALPQTGEIAFLFPGQGSQYPGMLRELAVYVPELRTAVQFAEEQIDEELLSTRLSRLMWPPASFSEEQRKRQQSDLADAGAAQLALAAASCGLLDFMRRLRIRPQRVAGHSFGEYMALHAAGIVDRQTLFALTKTRARAIADATNCGPAGGMVAVSLDADALRAMLKSVDGVVIANINAPSQCVLSGDAKALDSAMKCLSEQSIAYQPIAVSCAFHTPFMEPARDRLSNAIDAATFAPGELPVHAGQDGRPYPAAASEIGTRLLSQLEAPVDFVSQIRSMYGAGVRTFVELGPKPVLSGLVRRILESQPHHAIALDGAGGGMKTTLNALAQMEMAGVEMDLRALFEDMPARIDDAAPTWKSNSTWLIDGGRIRRPGEPAGLVGSQPLLTQATAAKPAGPAPDVDLHRDAGMNPASGDSDESVVSVYREYQETMRRFLVMQEEAVSHFLNRLGKGTDGELNGSPVDRTKPLALPAALAEAGSGLRGAAVHRVSAQTPAPELVKLNRATVTAILLDLISKQTGYPKDLLQLNQDLEADLGIDSLKRVEIFTRLEQQIGQVTGTAAESLFDRLEGRKSLNSILDQVMEAFAHASVTIRTVETVKSLTQLARKISEAEPCPRFLMRSTREEIFSLGQITPHRLFLVTEDEQGVAALVLERLHERNINAHLVKRHELAESDELDRRVLSLRQVHGPVQGIVHLAPLTRQRAGEAESWRQQLQTQTKSLFRFLQLFELDLQQATSAFPAIVLAATSLGGHWGRENCELSTAAGGGCHGLLRTLESENANVFARVIDFESSLPAEQKADCIVSELLVRGGQAEVGYAGDQRFVFRAVAQPVSEVQPDRSWVPAPGWVILITGGARGITGTFRNLAVPGARLVIVGLSPLREGRDAHQAPDLQAIREATLRSVGRRKHLTPVQIEALVQAEFRMQERSYNLAEFRRLGCEVEYHACDVRDERRFGELIDGIYQRYGRLDAVLHGAGVVEDEHLTDKTRDSFDRVFDTKAVSTSILLHRLRPEGLKWVVLFGSIAGRFGNRGQWDYAAGNEIVNRLAWQMDALWPDTRVVAINWGPWRGVGMADESLVRRFEKQGISPIDPEDGVRFLEYELTYGGRHDVEVVAGNGPWKGDSDPLVNSMLEVSLLLMQIRATTESLEVPV